MILSKLEAKESQGGNDAAISDLPCGVRKLLQDLASYETAATTYQKALSISERPHSDNQEHPDIARNLDGIFLFLVVFLLLFFFFLSLFFLFFLFLFLLFFLHFIF